MKKTILLLLSCFMLMVLATPAKSQIAKLVPATTVKAGGISSTLTTTDTALATIPVDGATQSVTVYHNKVAGTVSAVWYLQGTVKAAKWESIDSLVISNATGQKTFSFPAIKPYASYRLYAPHSGSGASSTFEIYHLRRN